MSQQPGPAFNRLANYAGAMNAVRFQEVTTVDA